MENENNLKQIIIDFMDYISTKDKEYNVIYFGMAGGHLLGLLKKYKQTDILNELKTKWKKERQDGDKQ